jgi:hypothetical protein
MGRLIVIAVVLATLGMVPNDERQTATTAQHAPCQPSASLIAVPDLPEGSGVALSRRTAGMLWSHNDSGEPMLVALDSNGRVKGRVRVAGAAVDDWEDVSAGPCAAGTCLYIADIGDNNRSRRHVTMYRVAEPGPGDQTTQPAEAIEATYPDGAHDAEAVFIIADDIFVVTKEGAETTALYRLNGPPRRGVASTLQRVGVLPVARVTDADASPDGAWVALRTNQELLLYPSRALVSGGPAEPQRVDLRNLKEPQGEGVTIANDGTVYLVGERGTFAVLRCRLPS